MSRIDVTLAEQGDHQHVEIPGRMTEVEKWMELAHPALQMNARNGQKERRTSVLGSGYHRRKSEEERKKVQRMNQRRCQSPCGDHRERIQRAT